MSNALQQGWIDTSGAQRSSQAPRYDLIPSNALRRLAARYQLGEANYGAWNWQKGLRSPEWNTQVFDHIIDHLIRARDEGCQTEDHLAAAAWGCFSLIEADALEPFADRTGSDPLASWARGRPREPELPGDTGTSGTVLPGNVRSTGGTELGGLPR